MDTGIHLRKIKSFVRRAGRTRESQQHALLTYAPLFKIPFTPEPCDFSTVFGNANPLIVEIGFGMGQSLLAQAMANPEKNYLGIEVHQAGMGCLLAGIHTHALSNLRLMDHDAVEILKLMITDASLSGVQIYFPDPWPKKRHHKRRLIQTEFIALLTQKLTVGGFIHAATDWQDYATQMLMVLTETPGLSNQALDGTYIQRPIDRPLTKFEQRGLDLGHGIWDVKFKKQAFTTPNKETLASFEETTTNHH